MWAVGCQLTEHGLGPLGLPEAPAVSPGAPLPASESVFAAAAAQVRRQMRHGPCKQQQTTTTAAAAAPGELTYVRVAERLLRVHRGAAARLRELLRAPHQQQRERTKDAVSRKRHFGGGGVPQPLRGSVRAAQTRRGDQIQLQRPSASSLLFF